MYVEPRCCGKQASRRPQVSGPEDRVLRPIIVSPPFLVAMRQADVYRIHHFLRTRVESYSFFLPRETLMSLHAYLNRLDWFCETSSYVGLGLTTLFSLLS